MRVFYSQFGTIAAVVPGA